MSDRFYFRQLLAGRDFARDDAVATAMVNFVYAMGDRESGEALLVDPAYRPSELVALVEADGMKVTGVLATHYHPDHVSGDHVRAGELDVTLIHTPGHTPGSQCFLVDGRLISGDTLFLEGCGRTDLPGSDPEEMYRTLTERLSQISDDTVLFPGHFYSRDPSASMGDVRGMNYVLAPSTAEQWLATFAR